MDNIQATIQLDYDHTWMRQTLPSKSPYKTLQNSTTIE